MQCSECGGKYIDTTEPLEVSDALVGLVRMEGVAYLKCRECGDRLLPRDAARALGLARDQKKKTLVGAYPYEEFVTAPEAQEILGMTRQAFSKNRRIKRGFIYSVGEGRHKMYLRTSVEQFGRTGDGRFPLESRTPFRATAIASSGTASRRPVIIRGESSTYSGTIGSLFRSTNRSGLRGVSYA
jgi:hypothetical protein